MRPLRIPVCPSPGSCPGYYLPDVPPGHPLAARWVPCACTVARQATAIKAALSPMYHEMTFETFRVEPDNREAAELARQFANDPWGQTWCWLVLIGPNGRGKTHLAAAIANVLLDQGEPVCFEEVPTLLDHLRAGYSPQGESFDRRLECVKGAPVLVLDDLGAESGSGQSAAAPFAVTWAQDKLYQVFNHRLVSRLPSVVTTNVPLDRLPPRLSSRLQDRQIARVKALKTGDVRKTGNQGDR